jgi:hypothetical protein
MAMGKRKRRLRQQSMWIATQDLPRSASHPFYAKLNRILEENGFDDYVDRERYQAFPRTKVIHNTSFKLI